MKAKLVFLDVPRGKTATLAHGLGVVPDLAMVVSNRGGCFVIESLGRSSVTVRNRTRYRQNATVVLETFSR